MGNQIRYPINGCLELVQEIVKECDGIDSLKTRLNNSLGKGYLGIIQPKDSSMDGKYSAGHSWGDGAATTVMGLESATVAALLDMDVLDYPLRPQYSRFEINGNGLVRKFVDSTFPSWVIGGYTIDGEEGLTMSGYDKKKDRKPLYFNLDQNGLAITGEGFISNPRIIESLCKQFGIPIVTKEFHSD